MGIRGRPEFGSYYQQYQREPRRLETSHPPNLDQLQNCEEGVHQTFSDITELAQDCRFSDCQHHNEPGCAVRAAIQNHTLDKRRFEN